MHTYTLEVFGLNAEDGKTTSDVKWEQERGGEKK